MKKSPSVGFHGAAQSTTGSRHLLEIGGYQLLLDCGLYQGHRQDTFERNKHFGFDPTSVDDVVLSHAHIDHSGNLPNLTRQGFKGSIYCTPATEDLCKVMLRDSAYIQMRDAEWITRRNRKRNRNETAEPLYTIDDVDACMEMFRSIHYHQSFQLRPNLSARFYDAGHILGSSSIVLTLKHHDRDYRLAFSGDIGRVGLPLLRDPEIPHDIDWLIMEGTYGSRTHMDIAHTKEELRTIIERVAARGGKIIVPSFSVERTQEVVYYLNELTIEKKIKPIPIYVDSPLAIDVTEIFRIHPECFDARTREHIMNDIDPFGFHRLTYVRDVEDSKRLNHIRMPCMIISASGMCEAGRIRHHLRNSIENPANCILFVGYQAEGTLGRAIVERKPEVNIFGEPYRLRAEVVTLNTLSGHADKNDLFHYARTIKETGPLKNIFLVHGEPESLNPLADRLRSELKINVTVPRLGETHSLPLKQ